MERREQRRVVPLGEDRQIDKINIAIRIEVTNRDLRIGQSIQIDGLRQIPAADTIAKDFKSMG